jgi:hypothetical protein
VHRTPRTATELSPTYVGLAIARSRMLYPDVPVNLDDKGHRIRPDYDTVAAASQEVAANAA